MAVTNLPSPEELRQLLDYDPETGVLTWRKRALSLFDGPRACREQKRWNGLFAGKTALNYMSGEGYRVGTICKVHVKAHRVAYAMQTGGWPEFEVDHVNGDRSDNRWCNLRNARTSLNQKNAKRRLDNTSGISGVFRHSSGKWQTQINCDGVRAHLGTYSCRFDAILARLLAERHLGFTFRHGVAA